MPKCDFKKVCMISIKLHSNFIEITLWHSSSPVNLQRIFRTPKNTSGGLLLTMIFLFKTRACIEVWAFWKNDLAAWSRGILTGLRCLPTAFPENNFWNCSGYEVGRLRILKANFLYIWKTLHKVLRVESLLKKTKENLCFWFQNLN